MRAAPSFHSRSRPMISSNASAARVAVAGRALARGKLEARFMVVGIGGEPALRARPCPPGAPRRSRARPWPGRSRVFSPRSGGRPSRISPRFVGFARRRPAPGPGRRSPPDCRAPCRGSGGRSNCARRVAVGQHLLGHRHQRLDLGLRRGSSAPILSWPSNWSSARFNCASVRKSVRSATGWPRWIA